MSHIYIFTLFRLSILAGVDRKWPRSARSSISGGQGSAASSATRPLRSPIRKMAEIISRGGHNQHHHHHGGDAGGGSLEMSTRYTNSNGRISSNFLNVPPCELSNHHSHSGHHHRSSGTGSNLIKDCLSPNGGGGGGGHCEFNGDSDDCSPVLGHKTCVIHGSHHLVGGGSHAPHGQIHARGGESSNRGSLPRRPSTKVSQSCQTIHTPPPGFDEDDCSSAVSNNSGNSVINRGPPAFHPSRECADGTCVSPCYSSDCQPASKARQPLTSSTVIRGVPPPPPPRAASTAPGDCAANHSLRGGGVGDEAGSSSSWMRCINPNHYHHHGHDTPLPITLTHNPIDDSTTTALLFHPPHYQCLICHHNASLYRALSNPAILQQTHFGGGAAGGGGATVASTSVASMISNPSRPQSRKSSSGTSKRPTDSRQENPDESCESEEEDGDEDEGNHGDEDDGPDETDEDEEEEDLDRQATPPPPLELRRHRYTAPASVSTTTFRDISGLREPLYADPKARVSTTSSSSGQPSSTTQIPVSMPIIPSSIPPPGSPSGPSVHWPPSTPESPVKSGLGLGERVSSKSSLINKKEEDS